MIVRLCGVCVYLCMFALGADYLIECNRKMYIMPSGQIVP